MKKIEKVSIALKPNVYSTFRNLNNTISNTLGEYVDNAVQSYLNHKSELLVVEGGNYTLRVKIVIDWEKRSISICDNAAGINALNYERAFEPAHIPVDDTGLNEFGMGMKTASVWLANKWSVRTKALGEDVERYTSFDLEKVTTEECENLIVEERPKSKDAHYTEIILTDLSSNAPKPMQMDKLKKHLSSIYRCFLRSGEVEISVNETLLEAPNYNILTAPFYKTPNGENILWKKEVDFEIDHYKAKGFIAILDKIQNGANGLVLMRRGRVIVGGGDERYFPSVIFGQSGSFRYRRLFGELELEGFEVSFNKNGFREEEELYLLMEGIRDELKASEPNLLSQTDNYRQRGKEQFEKLSKGIKKDLEKNAKPKQLTRQINAVETNVNNTQYLQKNEERIIKAAVLDSYSETFQYGGNRYILKIELVTETETDSMYSVVKDSVGDNADENLIICKINLAHPFFTRFEQFKKGKDYAPIIAIFKALTLAEIMASDKGTRYAANVRILFNQSILQM